MVVGAAAPTSAQSPAGPAERQFQGKSSYKFSSHGCSFVYQVFGATYRDAAGNAGQFRLAGCIGVTPAFTYTGTLSLTTPSGLITHGTVSGTVYGVPPPFPCPNPSPTEPAALSFVLVPDVGPTMYLTGTWCPGEVPTALAPILGVLSTAPPAAS